MTKRLRPAATTSVLAMTRIWPAAPERVAPVIRDLVLRYRDLPRLERLIERLERCRDDEAFRASPAGERILPLLPQLAEVTAALPRIKSGAEAQLQLAEGVAALQRSLSEANGASLESMYAVVPDGLKDFVELGYNSMNRPLVRPFEALLYRHGYDSSTERLHFFTKTTDEEYVPFRLPHGDEISWHTPFANRQMDRLFSGCSDEELAALLAMERDDPRLTRFFAEETAPVSRPAETGLSVRYFGHATVLVEWQGLSVLVDPLIPSDSSRGGPARFSFDDLPERIDCVLITHAHADHFDISTLLRLRHRVGTLAVPRTSGELGDFSLRLLATAIGFDRVVELGTLDSINIEAMEITALPFFGEHGDLALGKATWLVRAGEERMLFAADSKIVGSNVFARIRRFTGAIQTVFVGTCCRGDSVAHHYAHLFAWSSDTTAMADRRTDGADSKMAWSLLQAVGAERLFVYALGLEPWNFGLLGRPPAEYVSEAAKLVDRARSAGFREARVLDGAERIIL